MEQVGETEGTLNTLTFNELLNSDEISVSACLQSRQKTPKKSVFE